MSATSANPIAAPKLTSWQRRWLWSLFGLITLMVVVGGITRLTESGLSMVEWRPLMGTLPPLTEGEWQRVFAAYQKSPQYQHVNHWMTLGDFKRIFFWEYFHRLLGRFLGLWAVMPWLFFAAKKSWHGKYSRWVAIAIALGGAQGLLGWFMVKSGLVDMPSVSHFRLAAHLLLALAVGQWVLWVLLGPKAIPWRGLWRDNPWLWLAGVGLLIQLTYGAFVAGTRAGVIFPTFPDLNGAYLPATWMIADGGLSQWLYHPPLLHFVHRFWGIAVGLMFFVLAWKSRRQHSRWALGLVVAVLCQVGLGIATVLTSVNIAMASLHQLVAVVLLSLWTVVLHRHIVSPQALRSRDDVDKKTAAAPGAADTTDTARNLSIRPAEQS